MIKNTKLPDGILRFLGGKKYFFCTDLFFNFAN